MFKPTVFSTTSAGCVFLVLYSVFIICVDRVTEALVAIDVNFEAGDQRRAIEQTATKTNLGKPLRSSHASCACAILAGLIVIDFDHMDERS